LHGFDDFVESKVKNFRPIKSKQKTNEKGLLEE